MTPEEKQEIVQAVIAALKTNGRTIMQLTEATRVSDSDYFEIHGGRRIAYSHLYENLLSETENIIETFEGDVLSMISNKITKYDVDWIDNASTRTEENFNALSEAISMNYLLLYRNYIVHAVQHSTYIRIIIAYYRGFEAVDIWNNDGTITVNFEANQPFALEADLEELQEIVEGFKESFLTQAEYDALVDAGTIDPDTKYFIYED